MTLAAVICVLGGGFLGGMARFFLSGRVAVRMGETFPWGTVVVNVSGALAIGVLAGLAGDRPLARDFLMTGFCGGYTTVSSFALQTLALGLDGENRLAVLNVVVSTGLALAAVAGGFWMTSGTGL